MTDSRSLGDTGTTYAGSQAFQDRRTRCQESDDARRLLRSNARFLLDSTEGLEKARQKLSSSEIAAILKPGDDIIALEWYGRLALAFNTTLFTLSRKDLRKHSIAS